MKESRWLWGGVVGIVGLLAGIATMKGCSMQTAQFRLSILHNQQHDVQQAIDALARKRDSTNGELKRRLSIPRIDIDTATMRLGEVRSELEETLRSQPIPLTVEMIHTGGDAAKMVELRIHCRTPILRWENWSDSGSCTTRLLDASNLLVTARELAPSDHIGFTLFTLGPSTVTTEVRAERWEPFNSTNLAVGPLEGEIAQLESKIREMELLLARIQGKVDVIEGHWRMK